MVNGHDTAVKPRTIQVWTREETMEVARAGATIRQTVDAADGDRVRLRVRAPAAGLEPATVAVFVGEHWVGTAVVSSAATTEEASAASDALERELDARARSRSPRRGTKRRKKRKGGNKFEPRRGREKRRRRGREKRRRRGRARDLAFAAKRASLAPHLDGVGDPSKNQGGGHGAPTPRRDAGRGGGLDRPPPDERVHGRRGGVTPPSSRSACTLTNSSRGATFANAPRTTRRHSGPGFRDGRRRRRMANRETRSEPGEGREGSASRR